MHLRNLIPLFLFAAFSSCGTVHNYYLDESLATNKPKRVLYSQALGVSSINALMVGGRCYFDQQIEETLAEFSIKASPFTVDFKEGDSLLIAKTCRERGTDGILFTYVSRTYRDSDSDSYYDSPALSASSVVRLAYYNKQGKLISSLVFVPTDYPNVLAFVEYGIPRAVKSIMRIYQ